jgi:cardiolipin synthase
LLSRLWLFPGSSHRATPTMSIVIAIVATLVAIVVLVNLGIAQERVEYQIDAFYPVEDPQFLHVMGTLLGPPVVTGNSYAALLNGDAIFTAMLAAIRDAEKTIALETYIYWSGDIGRVFAEALAAKARAGVKVHLLLDWVGSGKLDAHSLQEMQDAGVQVERFHKPKLFGLARLNNRTHRKLLVVDGRIAFTGGVGIADQWTGNAQDPEHWRDTHFRVEGPVVAQVQAAFMDNWMKTTGRVFHGEAYFPRMDAPPHPGSAAGETNGGDGLAQMFSGSPAEGSGSMELMYLLAIQSATRTIRLSSSYFVPDRSAIREFVEATKRGVRVQIIVPGAHIDTKLVRYASKHMWGDLLAAGVEIHEYLPTMFHVKVMIVDEYLVSIGSTNFDDRSFHLNDESNLNIYDRAFAAEQVAIFMDDLRHVRPVTLDAWKRRSWREKAMERLAHLLQSQL